MALDIAVVRNARDERRLALLTAELVELKGAVADLMTGMCGLAIQVAALAAAMQNFNEALPGEQPEHRDKPLH